MTVEPSSWTGTVDKAPLKEPKTEGNVKAMNRLPTAQARQTRALPLRRRPRQLTGVQSGARVTRSSRNPGRLLPQHAGSHGPAGSWPICPQVPTDRPRCPNRRGRPSRASKGFESYS